MHHAGHGDAAGQALSGRALRVMCSRDREAGRLLEWVRLFDLAAGVPPADQAVSPLFRDCMQGRDQPPGLNRPDVDCKLGALERTAVSLMLGQLSFKLTHHIKCPLASRVFAITAHPCRSCKRMLLKVCSVSLEIQGQRPIHRVWGCPPKRCLPPGVCGC
jgi:hypothetical protein